MNQRYASIDILRGFALAGTLMMNLQAMGMVTATYFNPNVDGGGSVLDMAYWAFTHVFVENKFIDTLSMLFGAGIVLAAQDREPRAAAAAHYRRLGVLLVLGLMNAYLLWYGDVLLPYAICGALAFPLRRLRVRTQLIVAAALYIVPLAFNLVMGLSLLHGNASLEAAIAPSWNPPAHTIATEIAAFHSAGRPLLLTRIDHALFMQSYFMLTDYIWRITALMLLGMALLRAGLLQNTASTATLRRLAFAGCAIGLPLSTIGAATMIEDGFSLRYAMFLGPQFNYAGSVFTAVGYAALIQLWLRGASGHHLQHAMAAAGRISLTNYLLHGVVGTVLFSGLGLGLYGLLPRWSFAVLFAAVWALELGCSELLLRRVRQGPMEHFVARVARRGPPRRVTTAPLATAA